MSGKKNDLPGITRQDEERKLQKVLQVAADNLERTRGDVEALAEELHELIEEYDVNEREGLAQWHNTDARFLQANQELRRAQQTRKKPYFGRIDFLDKESGKQKAFYIGRAMIAADPANPDVIDWRAPIASVYYGQSLGEMTYSVKGEGAFEIDLSRKRTYEIENDRLLDFYDTDVVANDELLTRYLAKSKREVLGEIIATIQQEQNDIIRKKPQHNMIVQGAAGSGKTTVAMHRISYILYNYETEFDPHDFYVIGSNKVLLNYITGVLPDLNVYGVTQMTMEDLFIRLLYEAWDKKYKVRPVVKGITPPIKGTYGWFKDLEAFCTDYENRSFPIRDVILEKTGARLMSKREIELILEQYRYLSRADKITKLSETLQSRLENEIYGKYYSYPAAEKNALMSRYGSWFGRREWRGSIYELYRNFLIGQNRKGYQVDIPEQEFDVYDLAALAYLYKRIQETEIIREAGHVVIDEAQDFGMMVYGALKYCLSTCTYTIMGDVSQNISLDYGLNDWKELRELMLPEEYDYFGLLRKSYRNTVEISEFATNVLHHGSFQIYPVQPIIRHGSEVLLKQCASYEEQIEKTAELIEKWKADGRETIAVICSSNEEAAAVRSDLGRLTELLPLDEDHMEFGAGVMVLSLEYTKGLEFDGVLLFDASEQKYPYEDGYVKRLYVAATRALHELAVLYKGELTPLIARPVTEEMRSKAIEESAGASRAAMPARPEKTNAEIYRERAAEGEREMAARRDFGPKPIEAKAPADRPAAPHKVGIYTGRPTVPSYMEQHRRSLPEKAAPLSMGEYGEMPDNDSLKLPGHGRIDCSVRIPMKGRGCYELLSNYGTLHVEPVAQDVIHVCFAKGQGMQFPGVLSELGRVGIAYKHRETKDNVEILTEKILVRIEKKTGAVAFYTPAGKLILTEKPALPRQVDTKMSYVFFDWDKKEQLIARGMTDTTIMRLGTSAKYISFGKDSERLPGISSDKGYELILPPRQKILFCNISMYGNYVATEGISTEHIGGGPVIDYYFKCKL